jgi:hypothetical protein
VIDVFFVNHEKRSGRSETGIVVRALAAAKERGERFEARRGEARQSEQQQLRFGYVYA